MRKSGLLTVVAMVLAVLPSCATTHLGRWGFDSTSALNEPEGEFTRAVLKPSLTVLWMPAAVTFDLVTLPFQAIFGVHPYGDRFMEPDKVQELGL